MGIEVLDYSRYALALRLCDSDNVAEKRYFALLETKVSVRGKAEQALT